MQGLSGMVLRQQRWRSRVSARCLQDLTLADSVISCRRIHSSVKGALPTILRLRTPCTLSQACASALNSQSNNQSEGYLLSELWPTTTRILKNHCRTDMTASPQITSIATLTLVAS